MNLAERYHSIHLVKILESYLLDIDKSSLKSAFADARKELIQKNLCDSLSIRLKDSDTAIIMALAAHSRFVLLWDLRNKKIVYKGVQKDASS